MKVVAGLLLAAATVLVAAAQPQRDQLAQANAALQAGEADKALGLLDPLLQSGGTAEAHNLKCRVLYILERWDAAVGECEQAVKLEGQNASYHLWLGRALGEKADRASFLSAYSLAKRVREEFEEAARLSPRDPEALEAVADFYQSAPGVVGGGLDKAEGVAGRLEKIDPARGHELRGHIAEERKDYGTAEREFKQSIAAGAHPAFHWMTLASFYRRRQRWEEMESAVRSGDSAAGRDRKAAVALYNGASVLWQTKRDPALAEKMLESYLASPAKTEEAPAFVAHVWLAKLKEQLGDSAAAGRERAAAQALAHDYKPAQDGKH